MLFKQNRVCWFKKMSMRSLTYQQSVFKRYHGNKHFSEFVPTRWRQKSTGIDMEQNYVTVTLCITNYCERLRLVWWRDASVQSIYTVSQKKDPRHLGYNSSKNCLIFMILRTYIDKRLGNQRTVYFPNSPKQCLCTTLRNRKTQKSRIFTLML